MVVAVVVFVVVDDDVVNDLGVDDDPPSVIHSAPRW